MLGSTPIAEAQKGIYLAFKRRAYTIALIVVAVGTILSLVATGGGRLDLLPTIWVACLLAAAGCMSIIYMKYQKDTILLEKKYLEEVERRLLSEE